MRVSGARSYAPKHTVIVIQNIKVVPLAIVADSSLQHSVVNVVLYKIVIVDAVVVGVVVFVEVDEQYPIKGRGAGRGAA